MRAREKSLIVVSYRQKGRRPQCYTRAERARARARARAKYPGHFRPAKKKPYQWIFEFFLRDWQELDEILPTIATKNQKFEENLRKKFISKIAKFQTSTQFQTWNLHVNMMHCIARHNFKLRNDSFSYENWGPGIFLSLSLFKMHQKNVLVHALLRDPLERRALFRIKTNHRLYGELQRRYEICAANVGQVHAILSAQGALKFRKFCNLFAGFP